MPALLMPACELVPPVPACALRPPAPASGPLPPEPPLRVPEPPLVWENADGASSLLGVQAAPSPMSPVTNASRETRLMPTMAPQVFGDTVVVSTEITPCPRAGIACMRRAWQPSAHGCGSQRGPETRLR